MSARGTVVRAGRLDAAVAEIFSDLSRARAARLIKDGHVQVEGTVNTRPSSTVHVGDELVVDIPPPVPDEAIPQDLPISIVYQDDDVVVVDKAPGMVVHPAAGHASGTLVNALLHHVTDLSGIGGVSRPGIVHRLDKGTSGLMVVAKHDAAHAHLAAQFADHSAYRRYLAICHGSPREASGTRESELGRHAKDRKRFASVLRGGKRAVTHWEVLARGRTLSLIRCRLETGRTHQIRVHLSEAGWPLVGDPVYRPRKLRAPRWLQPLLPDDRPMLHAWELSFVHPGTGEPVRFGAEIPADFAAVADEAGLELP